MMKHQIGDVMVTPASVGNPYAYRGPEHMGPARRSLLALFKKHRAVEGFCLWYAPACGGRQAHHRRRGRLGEERALMDAHDLARLSDIEAREAIAGTTCSDVSWLCAKLREESEDNEFRRTTRFRYPSVPEDDE